MISKILSIVVSGLESEVINVEVDMNAGLPSFTIVWLGDTSVQESKERIRSAFKSSNHKLPQNRITINLAPADIKKSGPSFDLPIAVGLLHHMGIIEHDEYFSHSIFVWELSLDGSLRSVHAILPSVIGALEKKYTHIFIPADNQEEASVIEGIHIIPVHNLTQLVDFLNKKITIPPPKRFQKKHTSSPSVYDFSHIIGQNQAKRALEIAAAGLHNIILSGPPWSGKTLLAKTLPTILPPLTLEEMIEISKIYSVNGLLSKENPLIVERPFRSVHHTASSVSIIGGGRNAKPGEISLAHKWVLFLDEVLEFPKSVLEVLRQPLEDGVIRISRVHSSFSYPAKFMLFGAMNPCPCGYLTDPDRECICTPQQIKNYRSRLSGPMMDRIDMMIEVPKVKVEDFASFWQKHMPESSAVIASRVAQAKLRQLERFAGTSITSNSQMSSKQVEKYCPIDEETQMLLRQAVVRMNLSARAYYRVLKLARSIADLENEENILSRHVAEAIGYRKNEEM